MRAPTWTLRGRERPEWTQENMGLVKLKILESSLSEEFSLKIDGVETSHYLRRASTNNY